MATVTASAVERRRGSRAHVEQSAWRPDACLRPGLPVRIVNISLFGALVESPGLLRPGRAAELQLTGWKSEEKVIVAGRVGRCRVVRLSPLGYQGAIEFVRPLEGCGHG